MGYYTNYDIEATGFKDVEEAEFFQFKFEKAFGFSHTDLSDGVFRVHLTRTKWYNCVQDLVSLSSKFLNVLIEVEGNGEEFGDSWRARVRNGKAEQVHAKMVFPEFKELTQ